MGGGWRQPVLLRPRSTQGYPLLRVVLEEEEGMGGGHDVVVLDDTVVQWRDFIPITSCSVLLCRMHRMMGVFFF